MGIETVLGFGVLSTAVRLVLHGKVREWFLFFASLLAVFWLQPELPIRGLDFWLPLLAVGLAVIGWVLTSLPEERWTRDNASTAATAAVLVILLALTRYTALEGVLSPSQPPPLEWVLAAIGFIAGVNFLFAWRSKSRLGLGLAIGLLILILLVIKTPTWTMQVSIWIRGLVGQGTANAGPLDVRWLGFSYLAFRLIHTLRDRQAGRLPGVNLREYLIYLLFFPSFTAGPIDRLERFQKDLRAAPGPAAADLGEGARRLALGLVKKFILADGLAFMAMNSTNAVLVKGAGWAWVLLYAYTLQIFFDFSGYTDIAIGLGRILGFHLPENFNGPYLKRNLTLFWNSWHITLTAWFRGYFFNPLTRSLRKSRWKLSPVLVLLLVQTSTMVLIGMWHGVSWNFLIWGVWHGAGLFVQNRWSDWVGPRLGTWGERPVQAGLLTAGGWLLTFQYVSLGWVWFALPAPEVSMRFLRVLMGQ